MSHAESRLNAPLRLAVLISGGGTTLRNLLERIAAGSLAAEIALVISSNATAGGLRFAVTAGIASRVVEQPKGLTVAAFSQAIFDACRAARVDLVVCGGFLKLLEIPSDFQQRVVNIHPSLIPSFCGRGYYGHHVHQAVLDYGAKLTGCTVHFVDNEYDHGPIILQRAVPVENNDTVETLAARVFAAECTAYPEALNLIAAGRVRLDGRHVRILPAPEASAPR